MTDEDPKTAPPDRPDRDPSDLEERRRRVFEFIEQNWERTKDMPSEEIEALIDEAVRAVRAERRRQGLSD
jgi:hypothetical protein